MTPRRKPMSEINVVPYIDVMLVLLVIFMATAPLFTQGVEVDLPQAPSEPLPNDDDDPLVVSVRQDGAIFINIGMRHDDEKGRRVTIFSLEEDGELVIVDLERTGFEPVARYTVATSETWAQPVVSSSRVFVKDVSTLTLWTID